MYHPNGYLDLVEYLHSHGVDFMLWFEPERVRPTVSHWVDTLPSANPNARNLLAALNKDEVCDAIIEMVSDKIK